MLAWAGGRAALRSVEQGQEARGSSSVAGHSPGPGAGGLQASGGPVAGVSARGHGNQPGAVGGVQGG